MPPPPVSRLRACSSCGAVIIEDTRPGRPRTLCDECQGCNFGLGHFRDSPDLLTAAAAYLVRAPEPVLADVVSTSPHDGTIQAPHLDAFLP